MKKLIFSIMLFALTIPLFSYDLTLPYDISRKEWLEYEAFKNIKIETDAWATRIAFRVALLNEEGVNKLIVTLTTANGENPISYSAKNNYIEFVTKIVQRIIEKYEWAEGVIILVQFV